MMRRGDEKNQNGFSLLPKTCHFELSAIVKALEFVGSSMTCEIEFTLEDLLGFSPTRPFEHMESWMPEVPRRLVRVAKICSVLLYTKLRRALPWVVLLILSIIPSGKCL